MLFGAPAALDFGHDAFLVEREKLFELGATVIIGSVACCAGAVAVALTLCCMYDTASYWYHKVHFHSCFRKVLRVHEVFSRRKGELPLCPYCVESITEQASPQKVVFLCGHRFHMDCANRWFLENPGNKAGRCPICSQVPLALPLEQGAPAAATTQDSLSRSRGVLVAHGAQWSSKVASMEVPAAAPTPWAAAAPDIQVPFKPCEEGAEEAGGLATPAPAVDDSVSDEALAFILSSLHRSYPEIISDGCVKRWFSCNTELWLSELSCPRWQRRYPCCGGM